MIRPNPRSTMDSMTCLVTLNRELRLVLITASQSALDILRNVPSLVMPALLTRMSMGPCSALAFSKASLVDSQSATLPTETWNL